jgi:hypothetical protein
MMIALFLLRQTALHWPLFVLLTLITDVRFLDRLAKIVKNKVQKITMVLGAR